MSSMPAPSWAGFEGNQTECIITNTTVVSAAAIAIPNGGSFGTRWKPANASAAGIAIMRVVITAAGAGFSITATCASSCSA